jgi:hypothetical protein
MMKSNFLVMGGSARSKIPIPNAQIITKSLMIKIIIDD